MAAERRPEARCVCRAACTRPQRSDWRGAAPGSRALHQSSGAPGGCCRGSDRWGGVGGAFSSPGRGKDQFSRSGLAGGAAQRRGGRRGGIAARKCPVGGCGGRGGTARAELSVLRCVGLARAVAREGRERAWLWLAALRARVHVRGGQQRGPGRSSGLMPARRARETRGGEGAPARPSRDGAAAIAVNGAPVSPSRPSSPAHRPRSRHSHRCQPIARRTRQPPRSDTVAAMLALSAKQAMRLCCTSGTKRLASGAPLRQAAAAPAARSLAQQPGFASMTRLVPVGLRTCESRGPYRARAPRSRGAAHRQSRGHGSAPGPGAARGRRRARRRAGRDWDGGGRGGAAVPRRPPARPQPPRA